MASGIALGPLIEATVAAVGGLRGEGRAGMEKDMVADFTASSPKDGHVLFFPVHVCLKPFNIHARSKEL